MKATINRKTQTVKYARSVVYINSSEVDNAIGDFFSEQKIFNLDYKSKVWSDLKREVTTMNREAIAKALGIDLKEIAFSNKAGCSCGCSPGYIVKNPALRSASIWVDIEDCEVEASYIKAKLPIMEQKLKAEMEAHK